MKLILENWKKFLREQEENLTEEEIILYLQYVSFGLYKGQETNRLFWAPDKITSFNARTHGTAGDRAFKEAGINLPDGTVNKIREKIISKVNKGEKIGNYNITKEGVQNKHYGDALLAFMKKYGKPNPNVLYSGGTIELKGLNLTGEFQDGLWAYVSNLIDLGFPEDKMRQAYSKDPKSLVPPEGGKKLPSLKDYKMAVAKKLLKKYSYDSKIKKIAKDGGMGEKGIISSFDEPEIDIDLKEYGLDTGFGQYKNLKDKYSSIVKDIRSYEKDYFSLKNTLKNINPAQIPTRRRVVHSFSSDIRETTRFMKRTNPKGDSSDLSKEKGHYQCLMVVKPGDASKTMPIEGEGDSATTTEKETIIVGKYKTTKLDIHEDGFVVQYVKFE